MGGDACPRHLALFRVYMCISMDFVCVCVYFPAHRECVSFISHAGGADLGSSIAAAACEGRSASRLLQREQLTAC